MKLAIFFLLLISFQFISASPILTISDESPQPSETVLFELSDFNGSFNSDKIKIFEGRRETYAEKEVLKIENTLYFYIIFNREGNFTIQISNAIYNSEGQIKTYNLEKKINVKTELSENKSKILSIKPGFLDLSKNSEINLWNTGDSNLEIKILDEDFTIIPGDNQKIKIDLETGKNEILVNTYKEFKIPLKITNEKLEKPIEKINYSLKLTDKKVKIEIYELEKFNRTIEMENLGNKNLNNLQYSSKIDFLEIFGPNNLTKNGNGKFKITGIGNHEGVYRTDLIISYLENGTKYKLNLPVEIYIFGLNNSEEEIDTAYKCYDIGGVPCADSETCDGRYSLEIEGCCIGYCSGTSEKNETKGNKTLGIVLVLVIFVVGYFVWKKYKSIKNKSGSDKISEITKAKTKRKKVFLKKKN